MTTGTQPRLSGEVAFYLKLYRRVVRYGSLPEAGGLLDQPEPTMRILDVIDEEYQEAQERNREREKRLEEMRAKARSVRVRRR